MKEFWSKVKEFAEKAKKTVHEMAVAEAKKVIRFIQRSSLIEQAALSFFIAATFGATWKKIKKLMHKPEPVPEYLNVRVPASLIDKCFVHCLPKKEADFINYMDSSPKFERTAPGLNPYESAGVKI